MMIMQETDKCYFCCGKITDVYSTGTLVMDGVEYSIHKSCPPIAKEKKKSKIEDFIMQGILSILAPLFLISLTGVLLSIILLFYYYFDLFYEFFRNSFPVINVTVLGMDGKTYFSSFSVDFIAYTAIAWFTLIFSIVYYFEPDKKKKDGKRFSYLSNRITSSLIYAIVITILVLLFFSGFAMLYSLFYDILN